MPRAPDVLRLKPYLREVIWGGRGLADFFHKALPDGRPIGEAWEVSAHENAECIVATGPLAGKSLRQLVLDFGAELVGEDVARRYGTAFPLLVKLLDAHADLSVQVHPDDAYVRAEGLGTYGKMEAWYVLRSEGGRVACGLNEGVGRRDFEEAIRGRRVEDVVRFFEVRPGDVVFVPPGTVHALCCGVMLYEVQQASDLTFRIWDYDRREADGRPRALHIDRGLDVIAFGEDTREPEHWTALRGAEEETRLVGTEHFQLERFSPLGTRSHVYTSFSALTVVEGGVELRGEGETHLGRPGDTFFIPAVRPVTVLPRGEERPVYLIASVS